jgi:hypothetical protein
MFWYIVLGCLAIWAGNHYVDPMFGYWVAYVVIFVVGVCVVWIHLVKPLFFPTWRSSASVSGHRGERIEHDDPI